MVFYTDMLSLIPPYCNWYFEKCSSYDDLICRNVRVEDLVRVSFVWYVNIVKFFAWVNKQSTAAQGGVKMTYGQTEACAHTCRKHTNESVMLHLYNSLGGWEDLSEQRIQFIHAIRIKISNISPGKIPDDFQYQPPLSPDMRFVSSPSGRASVHSSFRNLASFMEPSASLSSHRRYEKDRHINLPVVLPESWRNMQKERKKSLFFSSSMSCSLLCFLISNRIHCTTVLLSLCTRKRVREWVSVCRWLWVLFCCCKWIHLSVCVRLSVLLCFCVYF